VLDIPIGVDHQTATLAWLVRALEQTRTQGRSKAVGYLEALPTTWSSKWSQPPGALSSK
jgi:hypothetical protein